MVSSVRNNVRYRAAGHATDRFVGGGAAKNSERRRRRGQNRRRRRGVGAAPMSSSVKSTLRDISNLISNLRFVRHFPPSTSILFVIALLIEKIDRLASLGPPRCKCVDVNVG